MHTTTVTTFGPDGTPLDVQTIDLPDLPTAPDLPTLADQVAALNDAVNLLILAALGI